MVIYEILTAHQPFEMLEHWKIAYEVIEKNARPDLPSPSVLCPQELISLIEQCWAAEPSQRPEASSVVKSLNSLIVQTENAVETR